MLRTTWLLRSSASFSTARWASHRRGLLTLAVESSADDTAVAVVETQTTDKTRPRAVIHFHEKITADNTQYLGIQPRNSAISHQKELPGLIHRALRCLPKAEADERDTIAFSDTGLLRKPTFIAATRGPGMRGGLSTGLDMAKGVCLAWNIPFLGVHHMQAHALTPRLISALSNGPNVEPCPAFPFRGLLVSGGHTMMLNNIAAGDCIDKMAKHILPPSILANHKTDTNYGAVLEAFAFPNGQADYRYTPPQGRKQLLEPRPSSYGWAVSPPLQNSAQHIFSFSGLDSSVRRIAQQGSDKLSVTKGEPLKSPMGTAERMELARHAQRVLFEHIADRIHLVLRSPEPKFQQGQGEEFIQKHDIHAYKPTYQLVVSGGVASSRFFRYLLDVFLKSRGIKAKLIFPPVDLCTDNALMIAWAGIEMWQAGHRSSMDCNVESRWPLIGKWHEM